MAGPSSQSQGSSGGVDPAIRPVEGRRPRQHAPVDKRRDGMEVIDPVTGERKTVEGTPEQLAALQHISDLVERGAHTHVLQRLKTRWM